MNSKTLAIMAVSSLALLSCKREKDEEPAPAAPNTGTVKLNFHFMHGADPFSLTTNYTDGASPAHAIRIDKLKFYASDFHLTDDNDVLLADFHDTYLLLDAAANNEYTLGTMAPGHIHHVEMLLGLEPEVNHADPTLAAAPLNIPEMHWSWNTAAGYKFLNMEGHVDGNGDSDFEDAEDTSFIYHCTGDILAREIEVHIHTQVTAGNTATLNAKVDVQKLLSGLDLLANPMEMGEAAPNITTMDSLAVSISEQ